MSVFYALLMMILFVMALTWLAYRHGKQAEKSDMQNQVAHKLWEEDEHDKHLDSITPTTTNDLLKRLRRNTKG